MVIFFFFKNYSPAKSNEFFFKKSFVELIHSILKIEIKCFIMYFIVNFVILIGLGPYFIFFLLLFFFFSKPKNFLFSSDDAIDLLEGLLERNPALRIGSGPQDGVEIMRHPFFKSIDFALVRLFIYLFIIYLSKTKFLIFFFFFFPFS